MKRLLRSPVMTGLMFVLATIMLFAGGIGSTQAALQYESSLYKTELRLKNIGVGLNESTKENGTDPKEITSRYYGVEADGKWTENFGNLIESMVTDAGDSEFKVGKVYPFYLTVTNKGQIDEYVRVTIYKYWIKSDEAGDQAKRGWVTGNGEKQFSLDPTLIKIIPAGSEKWELKDVTDERMVFYYKDILKPGDTTPEALTKGLQVMPGIVDMVTTSEVQGEGGTTIINYNFVYDGVKFVVEAQVDAVQSTHSAQSVPSAWGTAYVGQGGI